MDIHITASDIFHWKGERKRLSFFKYFLFLKLLSFIVGTMEMRTQIYMEVAGFPLVCYIVPSVIFLLLGIFLIYLFFCNVAKRLHDLGFKTVWAFFLTLYLEIGHMVVTILSENQKSGHSLVYYILYYSLIFFAGCLFLKKGKVNREEENVQSVQDKESAQNIDMSKEG